MARAAAAHGDVAAETRARVGAVLEIEAMRSSQDRHEYQQEYRERFAMVYSAAIRAAVRNDDPAAFITVFENLAGRRLAGLLEQIPAASAVENAQIASHVLATASNLPLDGGAPSLTLADHVRRSGEAGRPRTVGQWRSPEIRHHELVAFADDARVTLESFGSADAALAAVTSGQGHDLVVIAGHGRPVPGIVHYLELAPRVLLTPAALLDARTPGQLVLAACWGAHAPGAADSDPLTLATIALTRGSRAVLATTSELADDPLASRFLNGVLYRLPAASMPAALREMTRRFLADPRHRDGYLSRWAPLITVGTV